MKKLTIWIVIGVLCGAMWLCGQQKKPSQLQWAEGLVWYQIFPERFYNGDTSDDPTAEEVPGADTEPGWQIQPWTSGWYTLQPWEQIPGKTF